MDNQRKSLSIILTWLEFFNDRLTAGWVTDSRRAREDNEQQCRWDEVVLVEGRWTMLDFLIHWKQSQTHWVTCRIGVWMEASWGTSQWSSDHWRMELSIYSVKGIKEGQTAGARLGHFESVDTLEEILRFRIWMQSPQIKGSIGPGTLLGWFLPSSL